MKSDVLGALKDGLLPESGVEFERSFVTEDGREVVYGEESHSYATAESLGLKVVAWGEGVKVYHRVQQKPAMVDKENGESTVVFAGGEYRRMLIIEYGGDERVGSGDFFVHILGDLVVTDTRRRNIGEIAPGRMKKHRKEDDDAGS
jgi:hypothetical protein